VKVVKRRVKTPRVSCLSRIANGNRICVAFRKLKGKSYKNQRWRFCSWVVERFEGKIRSKNTKGKRKGVHAKVKPKD